MIGEREILEAMLNSTPEQCRAAGELFLALADRPRDIHFKADIQRRLDALPRAAAGGLADRLVQAREQWAKQDAELWKIGWHPSQLLAELKRIGFRGAGVNLMPPEIEELVAFDQGLKTVGLGGLAHNPGAEILDERERNAARARVAAEWEGIRSGHS